MTFSSLGLSESLMLGIQENGYQNPYPIQEKAIPVILEGKNIIGIAQTGSGKTAAFVLPILEIFQRKKNSRNLHLKVLILVPTRELAIQIAGVFDEFTKHLAQTVKHNVIYGGVSVNQQMQTLKNTEVLIATPGRLLEMIDNQSINLSRIEQLVLDEADKMLDLGFLDEVNAILGKLPKKVQTILFSATFNAENLIIKRILTPDFIKIEVESSQKNLDLIQQSAYRVSPENKGPLLRHLIKTKAMEQVLIFVSSVRTADNLVVKLRKNGIDAWAIHSQKSQSARNEAMQGFKKNNIKVLVATDLASRGIDVQFLPFVINYELPRSPKDYIHRIGRTGRAENSGEAISLVCPEDEHHFKIIQKKMGKIVSIYDSSLLDLK